MLDATARTLLDDNQAPPPRATTSPLDFGLNEGTHMPNACVEVLRGLGDRLALRRYGSPDNAMLRAAIAKADGVTPGHVFIREGSGPILRQVIPYLIKKAIMARPSRVLRHVIDKSGYPLVTTDFTYSKVPLGAAKIGLTLSIVPLSPATFRLDELALAARLERRDGLVYLANPNNPTGNVLLSREAVSRLAARFPNSLFWIDEAYVQYLDPRAHAPIASVVPRHENVIVSRSFSFAYGLAAARVGYMVAPPKLVQAMDAQLTPYRVGALPEALAIAALADEEHLPWLRAFAALERAFIRDGIESLGGIETFPSDVNFVLCRFKDGRHASPFARRLAARGFTIKVFEPMGGHTFDPYFRITLGTREENARLVEVVASEVAT
ncbi:MAG TPA: histidinol-phosphate transaminase, partial [Labilithrix sp.]|nr:histidinol-phosphate transaminase [Labilithrix sp.]